MGIMSVYTRYVLLRCIKKFVKHHVKKLTHDEEVLKTRDCDTWFSMEDAYYKYIETLPKSRGKYMDQHEFNRMMVEVMACKYGVLPWDSISCTGYKHFNII